jgi:hypothetical protein
MIRNKEKDIMGDSVFMEKAMRVNIGDKPRFTHGVHHINKEGLKFFYESLGHEAFKTFMNTHDVYTNKKGLRFVRRRYGKRNEVKTHIRIFLRNIKNL